MAYFSIWAVSESVWICRKCYFLGCNLFLTPIYFGPQIFLQILNVHMKFFFYSVKILGAQSKINTKLLFKIVWSKTWLRDTTIFEWGRKFVIKVTYFEFELWPQDTLVPWYFYKLSKCTQMVFRICKKVRGQKSK